MATQRRPVLGTRRYPHPDPAPRIVRDFNTLDDLIAHSGATHLDTDKNRIVNKLYVPDGGGYQELRVWQKEGYWHAQNPEMGKTVNRLPSGAAPIINRSPKKTPMWQRAKQAFGVQARERSAHHPIVRSAERLYHVVAINERTGRKTYLTSTPVTHHEGVTIMRKQSTPRRDVRIQLEPAHADSRYNPETGTVSKSRSAHHPIPARPRRTR